MKKIYFSISALIFSCLCMNGQNVMTGTTDVDGNVTLTYVNGAYPVSPMIVASLPNQSDKSLRFAITNNGLATCTINVYRNETVTSLPVIGSLLGTILLSGTTENVSGIAVEAYEVSK